MTNEQRTSKITIPGWKYEKIEKKVARLYVEQQITEVPIDPFEIIKNRGYVAVPYSQLDTVPIPEKTMKMTMRIPFSSLIHKYSISHMTMTNHC